MSHKVLILDDKVFEAEQVQAAIQLVDRQAGFAVEHNVEDARRRLDGHLAEFHYAVIDLDMQGKKNDQQGEALLTWLKEHDAFRNMPVLVVSMYPDRLKELPRNISRQVTIERRHASASDNENIIRRFVEKALLRNREVSTSRS
jgi:hypothetical protein